MSECGCEGVRRSDSTVLEFGVVALFLQKCHGMFAEVPQQRSCMALTHCRFHIAEVFAWVGIQASVFFFLRALAFDAVALVHLFGRGGVAHLQGYRC